MDKKVLVDKIKEAEEYRQQNPTSTPGYGFDGSLPLSVSGNRVEVEFYCNECKHYIYIKINTGLEGNHIIHCPICDHEHFRVVVNGIITSDRHDKGKAIVDEIVPMKSAAVPVDQRRQRGAVAVLREMEACGLLK